MNHTHPASSRCGFTLLELTIVVGIIAVIASMILPMLSDQDRMRLTAASSVLTSDIELAQSMSIATPDALHGVHFEPAKACWWISKTKTPDTPIVREDTNDVYLVTLGADRGKAAAGVTFTIDQIIGSHLGFDSRGGLAAFTAQPSITFTLGDQWVKLAISPNTGSITETYGTAAPAKN